MIRVLVWKEVRENIYKFLSLLSICLVLNLLRLHDPINQAISTKVNAWILALGIVSAFLLGMDAVAGERNKGTLNFLLSRPISAVTVLLPKFLVGAASLLLIVAVYWAFIYLLPDLLLVQHNFKEIWTVEDVAYPKMVLIWFLPLLITYSFVFLASVIMGDSIQAVVGGILLSLSGMFAMLTTVSSVLPDVGEAFYLTNHSGEIVRLARDTTYLLERTGLFGFIVSGLFALAAIVLAKCRDWNLGWRTLLTGWVMIAGGVGIGALISDQEYDATPVGIFHSWDNKMLDFALVGHISAIATEKGLRLVDVSDPAKPVEVGQLEIPFWSLEKIAVSEKTVYALGRIKSIPDDSVGVAAIDVSVPSEPVVKNVTIFGSAKEFPKWIEWVVEGEYLYAATHFRTHSSEFPPVKSKLSAFKIDKDGRVEFLDTLVCGPPIATDSFSIISTNGRISPLGLGIVGNKGYLTLPGGLVVVDLTNPRKLQESNKVYLETRHDVYWNDRLSDIDGDRLFVERIWPEELVALDISNPDQPVEIDQFPWATQQGDFAVSGSYIYRKDWDEIKVFKSVGEGQLKLWSVMGLQEKDRRGVGFEAGLTVTDEYIYALLYNNLVIYHTPGI